jgi:hypothetical protein
MTRRRANNKGRSDGQLRYVALFHWVMRTPAWRTLDCVSRAAYLEISSRYAGRGSNNGRIPYSLREMAAALGVSKETARRALVKLQELGFIVMTKKGAFSVKVRVATEWRLTEFACDVTGAIATKDFARWQPAADWSKNKTRSRLETHAVPLARPDGLSGEPCLR